VPGIESTVSFTESAVLTYMGKSDGDLYLDGKVHVSGTVDSLGFNTGLRIDWGKNLHTFLMGSGGAKDILRSSRQVQGYAQLLDYSKNYNFLPEIN